MSEFSQYDEKEFLESYSDFSIEARPMLIKILTDRYKKETNEDIKGLLFLLSMEQFFMLYETLEGFFRAVKDREKRSIFRTLTKDLNIQNLFRELKDKSENELAKLLNVKLEDISTEMYCTQLFANIAKLFQNKNFYDAMDALIPAFNGLKHKFLIYKSKKKKDFVFVIAKEKMDKIKTLLKKHKIDSNQNASPNDNIDFLSDMAERLKCAIQEIIAIRLLETGNMK